MERLLGAFGYAPVDHTPQPKQVWKKKLEEMLGSEVAERCDEALPELKHYFTDENWLEFLQELGIYVGNARLRREENYQLLQTGGESQMDRTVRQTCETLRTDFQIKVSQLAINGVWPDEARRLLGTILWTVEFLTNPFAPSQLLSDLVFNILPIEGRVSHLAERTGEYLESHDVEQNVIFGSARFQRYGEVYVSTEWVKMGLDELKNPQPLNSALRMTFYVPGLDCLTFTLPFSIPELNVHWTFSAEEFLQLFHWYLRSTEEEQEKYLEDHRGELRKVVTGHADLLASLTKFYHAFDQVVGEDFHRQLRECGAQWDPDGCQELSRQLSEFAGEWGEKRFNPGLGMGLAVYSSLIQEVGVDSDLKYGAESCQVNLRQLQGVVDLSSVRGRVGSSVEQEVNDGLRAMEEYARKDLATLEEFEELRLKLKGVEALKGELEILEKSHELRKALWVHYQKLSPEVKAARAALEAFSRKERVDRSDVQALRKALEPVKEMAGFQDVYATLANFEEGFDREKEAVAEGFGKFLNHTVSIFEEGTEQLAKPKVAAFLQKDNVNQADVQGVLVSLEPYKAQPGFQEVYEALEAFKAARFKSGVDQVINDFKVFFEGRFNALKKIGEVEFENFLQEFCVVPYRYVAPMRALLEPLAGSAEAVAALDAYTGRLKQSEALVKQVEKAMAEFKEEVKVRFRRFSPLLGRIGATERDTMLTNLEPYLPLIRRIGALGELSHQLTHEEYHNLMVALENPDNEKYIEWVVKGCEEVQAQRVGGETASSEVWLQPLRTLFSAATLPPLDIVKHFMGIADLDDYNYAMLTYLLPLLYKLETFGLTDHDFTQSDPLYRGLTVDSDGFTVQFKRALEWIVKACQALNTRFDGAFKRDFDEVVRLLKPVETTDAVYKTQVSRKAREVLVLVAKIADLGMYGTEDHAKIFSGVVRDQIRPELEKAVRICECLRELHLDQEGQPHYLLKPDREVYEPWQKPLVDLIRRVKELEHGEPLGNVVEAPPGASVHLEDGRPAIQMGDAPSEMGSVADPDVYDNSNPFVSDPADDPAR